MPRKRNPLAIAAGKLILAIQKESDQVVGTPAAGASRKVLDRAHTLLQATNISSASSLLDGRSLAEYLDIAWVEAHPAVKPSIDAFTAELNASEAG